MILFFRRCLPYLKHTALQALVFPNVPQLSDRALDAIIQGAGASLQKLALSGTRATTPLVHRWPSPFCLRALFVARCSLLLRAALRDTCVVYVPASLPGCLAACLPSAFRYEVRICFTRVSCNLVTYMQGWTRLVNRCPKLQHLGVSDCEGITDSVIETLTVSCPRLKHLNLARCVGLSQVW